MTATTPLSHAERADRLPPLQHDQMDAAQRAAAAELVAGPRKGVKGPFVPLLRSPELMSRLQRVGEYLRFESALPARIGEFATLVVSREWTQQFEWGVHVPLALAAGTQPSTIDALADGRRPATMCETEAIVFDFVTELCAHRGVCDATYEATVRALGERGLIDLVGLVGYFTTIAMVLNVAHTPGTSDVPPLPTLPR
jgi:4-carboxymuconolactone decarboxylase